MTDERVAYYLASCNGHSLRICTMKISWKIWTKLIFFNMDDSKTLGLRGSANVNYFDGVGGADGFTLVLRLCGGCNAKLINTFTVLKNRDRNYRIINSSDNISDVSYRTQPLGWMDSIAFNAWLEEPCAINMDVMNRTRHLFVDNCSGHKLTETVRSALKAVDTEVLFIPPNTTHLCKPLDFFIIQKLKAVWCKELDEKKEF